MSAVFSGVFKHSFICLAFAVFIHVRGGGGGGRGVLYSTLLAVFSQEMDHLSQNLYLSENRRYVKTRGWLFRRVISLILCVLLIRLIERILFQMNYPFEVDNPSLVQTWP